jgi:anti-sigma B factor antagonist
MKDELFESGTVVVFRPGSRMVDQNNAKTFLEPLGPATMAGRRIVLDLSSIQFLNSAGLGSIVVLIRDVKQNGGQIRLCSPLSTVRALFKMVHLENLAPIDSDLEASLKALADSNA